MNRLFVVVALAAAFFFCSSDQNVQAQERGFGQTWGGQNSARDYQKFYHYPYVYYPQNYYGRDYYRSADSMYYRYPAEMRIPVYNKQWHNFYPSARPYHWGHHFILDVF